jgi:dTDP-4-amino-4,6-dideoxygalactose transaminase
MYHLRVGDGIRREDVLGRLRERGVDAVFHYVPLHSSPAGRAVGRAAGSLEVTDHESERLLRLPLWTAMTEDVVQRVVDAVASVATALAPSAGRSAA